MTIPTDHITIRNIRAGHLLACAHCGAIQIVTLPIAMPDWLAASDRFMKAHRHCQPQAALPDGRAPFEVGAGQESS